MSRKFQLPWFLVPFKYPFYNVTDTRCGLIKVNCTPIGGNIQIGGRSYEIVGKHDFDHKFDLLIIRNRTFEQLVENKSCEALMNTITFPSPSSLLYSISINPNITLFKCTKNLTYFDPRYYKSYNRCNDHIFYYNYFNVTVPSDLPHTCQVVHLPVKFLGPRDDETNIFSLLPSEVSIFFELSPHCIECQKKGRVCNTENGNDVQCLDVKWGIYSFSFLLNLPSCLPYYGYTRIICIIRSSNVFISSYNIYLLLFGCYRKIRERTKQR
ncbi:hypothetical protein Hanom_Chr15g01387811 [Helianthus anomalus]